LNASRLLIMSLLMGDMILGFGHGPAFPKIPESVNYLTVTSYATSTSTLYSYLYPTIITRFSSATMTTDRLTQTGLEGPYVLIAGSWGVFVEGILEFNVTIKNLMESKIQQGIIQFNVAGLKVHRDDIELGFAAIQPGETTLVKSLIGVPGVNPGAKVAPMLITINLSQEGKVIVTVAVETSTRNKTVTETYRKTIVETIVYTMEEPFLGGSTTAIVGLILAAATLVAAFTFTKTKKRLMQKPSEIRQSKYRIEPGSSYIVEDNVGAAYEAFREALVTGMNGLCVTRVIPKRVRERYELNEATVVWLTDEAIEGQLSVSNLNDLSIMISEYVKKNKQLIVLVDGVEYLVSRFGFDSVYQFLQTKRSQIERTNNALIITLFKEALDPKEVKLLERELQPLAEHDNAHA